MPLHIVSPLCTKPFQKTLHIERAAASIGTLLPTPPLQESVGSIYKMAINSKQRLYCTLQYIKLFNVINYCDLIITAMLEAGSLKLSYRLENFPSSRLVAGDSVIDKIPPSAPKPCCPQTLLPPPSQCHTLFFYYVTQPYLYENRKYFL